MAIPRAGVGKIFHNWHTKIHGDPQSWSAPEFLHYANHAADDVQVPGAPPPNLATTTGDFGYPKNGICECRDVPDEAYYDGRVAAEAGRVLGELMQHKEPFFLAVGFWKPHAPFNAPKKYWDLYDRAKLPPLDERNALRPLGAPDLAFHDSTEVLGPVKGQKRPTPAQAAEMRHGYFANISYLDAQLGKVLDALEASGAADRTVVIFFSDHGFHIGEHALWGKTSSFELDARVPLFVHAPGMRAAGRRTASPTELIDLFPTLVSLCGLPMPAALEGANLAPLLDDPALALKSAAFTQHPRPAFYDREPAGQPSAMGVSVRTARVRYTEWRDWKTGHVVARELYDALNDRHEMRNAVDLPALAAAQTEAAALLSGNFRSLRTDPRRARSAVAIGRTQVFPHKRARGATCATIARKSWEIDGGWRCNRSRRGNPKSWSADGRIRRDIRPPESRWRGRRRLRRAFELDCASIRYSPAVRILGQACLGDCWIGCIETSVEG
jgi:iduronate 2-sulfatase